MLLSDNGMLFQNTAGVFQNTLGVWKTYGREKPTSILKYALNKGNMIYLWKMNVKL